MFKTHLALRTYLSLTKHFVAWEAEYKKSLKSSKVFENVDLDVYRPQFPLNTRRVKNGENFSCQKLRS